jgi:peptide-methionine (R)-S-oxide reductase
MSRNILIVLLALSLQRCGDNNATNNSAYMDSLKKNNPVYSTSDTNKVKMNDEEWKKILPASVYRIARMKGTEMPGTSEFEHSSEIGTFYCAACGNPLFKSDTKFESGCGWPSLRTHQ